MCYKQKSLFKNKKAYREFNERVRLWYIRVLSAWVQIVSIPWAWLCKSKRDQTANKKRVESSFLSPFSYKVLWDGEFASLPRLSSGRGGPRAQVLPTGRVWGRRRPHALWLPARTVSLARTSPGFFWMVGGSGFVFFLMSYISTFSPPSPPTPGVNAGSRHFVFSMFPRWSSGRVCALSFS